MAVWSAVKLSEMYGAFRWDAECHTPRMLRDQHALAEFRTVKLGSIALVTDGQHGYHEVDEQSPVRHLTAKCVGPGVVIDKDADRLALATHEANPESNLEEDDILLSTAGTIGEAGIVTAGLLPANIDQDVARIKLAKDAPVDPYFVCAFLRSEFGQFQCERGTTGQIQGHINLTALRAFEIPVLPHRQRISEIMRDGVARYLHSFDAISAAETLLVSALGLDHIDLLPSQSYSRPFKDLIAGHRFGAEYYMPSKQRALDALAAMPHSPLHDPAPNIRNLWEPANAGKGAMVRNFDLGDALEPFLDDTKEPMLAAEVGSTKKQFKAGDVVVSRLRSYLREIAVARTGSGVPCVGSSEFIVLRPTGKGLSAETILVYLRCPLVQTILKWSQDGSNHPRFNEDDLMTLPVPDKLREVSPKIERHVQAAIASRQEAVRLLDNAKTIVQKAILGETGS